jgi:hypothetical protein
LELINWKAASPVKRAGRTLAELSEYARVLCISHKKKLVQTVTSVRVA